MWSAPIVVDEAAEEPVSLQEAKNFLRIDGSALDDQVSGWIAAARAHIEQMTSTRLVNQVVTVAADSFRDLAELPIGAVTDIIEINYLAIDGSEQLLDVGVYELFGAGLDRGIRPQINMAWPRTRPVAGAISVTLAVGYGETSADMPKDLWLALLQTVRGTQDDAPADVDHLLVNHRIWL